MDQIISLQAKYLLSIQDEINLYNEKGNEAYKSGYNHDAIVAYE